MLNNLLLKLGFKGHDGKARPGNLDEEGNIKVKISGTLTELEQVRESLDAISEKDFATQTTLAAVLAKLADLESELATIKANQLSGDQKVQLSGTLTELEQARELLEAISGKDFATQITLEAALTELVNVKSELETIKANQLSGDQKVQLSGTIFGADISDRPPADNVPVGTTFVITNAALDAWISNGTDWVVI